MVFTLNENTHFDPDWAGQEYQLMYSLPLNSYNQKNYSLSVAY
jgi:hypothetical protein